ncbi:amidohydrolase [Pseudoroseomonas wenyumeiae]|uniref:Amidohydrolase n=1 Tax=Teichococcus wenyumeiae TaxID=2478470 RepID=A0A3A9JFA3_9PROT|nr:amidohydrolase [Pseudoroseomonas wenyumeiae]RKK05252.1 amidohydrolase [Pseudoroseomonas wenyumeiae]RMI19878.1 amidohydrolase [Pseudoroseomonas wenyumeiae]
MFLTNRDAVELAEWRRGLHRMPELSGQEAGTARAVQAMLAAAGADHVLAGLGGHGVAAIFEGAAPGPTVMFRAELDGLPIQELSEAPHRSGVHGRAHACGHDGHMAMLAALARGFGRQRPQRGRVVLLFQPAEEDGTGAAAVIADPAFAAIRPDLAFACHNMPGLPFGAVALAAGPANCASAGMRIVLSGRTAHASAPETGLSPMAAVARLMPELTALGGGDWLAPDFAMVTVTHAALGEPCFGIAPGQAEVWCTLRTLNDARMQRLRGQAEALARQAAADTGLDVGIVYQDVFNHCENAPEAVAHLRRACEAEGIPHGPRGLPLRASEDFGRFRQLAPSAMFLLGAGEGRPSLHNPDYDFPDDLIAIGARIFMRTARDILGPAEAEATPQATPAPAPEDTA